MDRQRRAQVGGLGGGALKGGRPVRVSFGFRGVISRACVSGERARARERVCIQAMAMYLSRKVGVCVICSYVSACANKKAISHILGCLHIVHADQARARQQGIEVNCDRKEQHEASGSDLCLARRRQAVAP